MMSTSSKYSKSSFWREGLALILSNKGWFCFSLEWDRSICERAEVTRSNRLEKKTLYMVSWVFLKLYVEVKLDKDMPCWKCANGNTNWEHWGYICTNIHTSIIHIGTLHYCISSQKQEIFWNKVRLLILFTCLDEQ